LMVVSFFLLVLCSGGNCKSSPGFEVGVVQEIRDHLHETLLQGDAAQSNHRRRRIVSE
jgi:hypothetical protein